MRYVLITLFLVFTLSIPVQAIEFQAPKVPKSGEQYMPKDTESFAEGLWYIIKEGAAQIRPSITECCSVCFSTIICVILCSIVKTFPGVSGKTVELVGTLLIGYLLLKPSNTMIHLGAKTIEEISTYGKLLFPVLTAALAAGGGVTQSTSLYAITVAMNSILSCIVSSALIPGVYMYLCLSVVAGAIGNHYLEKIKSFVKWTITWGMKILLYIFTGFISITGVVSGTTDASAVKATKLTISGMVPAIGNILSDASETVLVSAALVRNAAGIYGLLAVLSVWIAPFIRIGTQYLLFKLTWSFCDVFSTKETYRLIGDFSTAMGIVLAMTGTVCILLLVSVICFMKGVGI